MCNCDCEVVFCVTAVVNAVDGQDCSESMRVIAESGFISEDKFNHVVAGLYAVVKEAQRWSSLKQEVSHSIILIPPYRCFLLKYGLSISKLQVKSHSLLN